MRHAAVLAAFLTLCAGTLVARGAPNDGETRAPVVEAIAERIRAIHFDAAEGERIARAFTEGARGLSLDVRSKGDAWAERATASLRRISGDKHFRVFYDPSEPAADGAQAPLLDNGIRAVETPPDGICRVVLSHFPPDDPSARAAYGHAFALLAPCRALVLDVRDNRGGDPRSVAQVMSYLFARPPFVTLRSLSRGKVAEEISTTSELAGPVFGEARPVAVLTSRRTFSGGEALAYDLKAFGRAEIVGETTGGAANPALMLELPGGFGIAVPRSTPVSAVTGTNWEAKGVTPDVPSPAARSLQTAHARLTAALATSRK